MAHIWKYPTADAKGIVVLTHKEVRVLTTAIKDIRFQTYNRIKERFFSVTKLKKKYRADVERLRERYFIGVHFGWRHDDYPTLPFVDFYMSGAGTVTYAQPDEIFWIPFNSRAFTSDIYRPNPELPKRYDLMYVGRDIAFKNVDRLLVSIRKMYDAGKRYRVLMLVLPHRDRDNPRVYKTLADDYYRMFSAAERQDVVLLYLNAGLSIMGLPRPEVVHLYQQAKVFTLFTEQEGESRVITEALLTGLPVVVWDQLSGGGRDLLTAENSVQFPSFDVAHEAFIEAIENYERFDVANEDLFRQTRVDYVLPQVKSYFTTLYAQHGQAFDGELINSDDLADRLPGHYADVPWAGDRFNTADITRPAQWATFMAAALGGDQP